MFDNPHHLFPTLEYYNFFIRCPPNDRIDPSYGVTRGNLILILGRSFLLSPAELRWVRSGLVAHCDLAKLPLVQHYNCWVS